MKNIVVPAILLVIGLIVGFYTGIEYTRYKIANSLKNAFSEPVDKSNVAAQNIKKEQEKLIVKNMGEDVELATIIIKINSAKEENVIQSKYGSPKVASEGTKFVILDTTVTNITKAPFSFYTDGLVLIDSTNTKYNPYSETIGNIDNYLDVQEISPNIPKTGVIVYEVPKKMEKYSFSVSKAGTNDTYRVVLK